MKDNIQIAGVKECCIESATGNTPKEPKYGDRIPCDQCDDGLQFNGEKWVAGWFALDPTRVEPSKTNEPVQGEQSVTNTPLKPPEDKLRPADRGLTGGVQPLPLIPAREAVLQPAPISAVPARTGIREQVDTARRHPRSVEKFRREALTLATLDPETAGSMFYVIPRDGKNIEGPSARLAEIVMFCWTNMMAQSDVVGEDEEFVYAVGRAIDFERNVSTEVKVRRRITNKEGRRFNADMIAVTSNAAASIAKRNAVLQLVPFAVVKPIYEAARLASVEGGTMEEKRNNMLTWFKRVGIEAQQVFDVLGVLGPADIGEHHLIKLRGIKTAIEEGDVSAEVAFALSTPEHITNPTTEQLNALLDE